MKRITAVCLLALTFSLLHNIYLFNVQDEEEFEDDELNTLDSGRPGVVSRFIASSIRRVKRRIFFNNETIPDFDEAVFGNRTGRNKTVSLIKLLNKNYYLIKKHYFELIANQSATPPPAKFDPKRYASKSDSNSTAAADPAQETEPEGGTSAPDTAQPPATTAAAAE